GDEEVDLFFAGDVAALAGADGVPGGQAGDVGGEEVLAGDGDTHLEQGMQKDQIGRLAAAAVNGGDLEAEVVEQGGGGIGRGRGVSRGEGISGGAAELLRVEVDMGALLSSIRKPPRRLGVMPGF